MLRAVLSMRQRADPRPSDDTGRPAGRTCRRWGRRRDPTRPSVRTGPAAARPRRPVAATARSCSLVADGTAEVAVGAHHAVAMELGVGAARPVHRDVIVVHAQAVALRVAVGEETPLQHLVRRKTDAGTTFAGLNAACSTSAK